MPTAAKLLGAFFLALTTVVMSYAFDAISISYRAGINFYAANAFIGAIVGWKSIGNAPGYGGPGSIVAGIRGSITLVFWTVFSYSTWDVIEKLKNFYIKEVWDILDSFMGAALNYASLLLDPMLISILLIGGCISGIMAGLANRFWP